MYVCRMHWRLFVTLAPLGLLAFDNFPFGNSSFDKISLKCFSIKMTAMKVKLILTKEMLFYEINCQQLNKKCYVFAVKYFSVEDFVKSVTGQRRLEKIKS
jgi:hypothetical protein